MNEPNKTALDAALAMAQFTAQRKRELRKQEARASGIKLIARGAVVVAVSSLGVWLSPPDWFTPLMALTTLGGFVVAFGALKIYAARQL